MGCDFPTFSIPIDEAQGLGNHIEVVLEALPCVTQADHVWMVHQLQVVPEDLFEGTPPVPVGLLPGHDLHGSEFMDPAVFDDTRFGVDALSKVYGHTEHAMVEHVVPRLLEVSEHLVGDEHPSDHMGIRIQRQHHLPRWAVQ